MIIDKLNIDGFGIFYKKKIEGFSKGMNVLYGPNEAGKSTLLDFIRFTLFEYPRLTTDRRPPLNGGDHSGTIWMKNSSSEDVSVYRHGNAKDFQLEYKGVASPNESLYKTLIGNASLGLYKNIYAISLDELSSVSQLDDSGMTERIFSMGMGLSGVNYGAFEDNLIKESDAFFITRGKVQKLLVLVDEIQEKETIIDQLKGKLGDYNRLSQQKEDLNKELEELSEKRKELNNKSKSLSNLSKAYPDFILYQDAAQKIAVIGELVIHPIQIFEQYEVNKEQLKDKGEVVIQLKQSLKKTQDDLDHLKWNKELSEHAALLDYFKSEIKLYEAAKNNLDFEKTKNLKAKTESETIIDRLGADVKTEDLIALEGTFKIQTKATETYENQQKLEQFQATKSEVEVRLKKELSDLEVQKDEIGKEIGKNSIQNEVQRTAAIEKKTDLETAFKVALQKTDGKSNNSFKLPLILVIVFFVLGGLLLLINHTSGEIVLCVALVGLIVVLLQTKRDPMVLAERINPVELNRLLTQTTADIEEYDALMKDYKSIEAQFIRKGEETQNVTQEVNKANQELADLKENWTAFLQEKNLPLNLTPVRMNDFITLVEKLKQQKSVIEETQASIQTIEQRISDFEHKIRQVAPQQEEISLSFIHSLISKMEENEKIHTDYKRLTEKRTEIENENELALQSIQEKQKIQTGILETLKAPDESAFYNHFNLQKELEEAKSKQQNASETIKTVCGATQLDNTIALLKNYTNPAELDTEKEEAENNHNEVDNKFVALYQEYASTQSEIRHLLKDDDMYALQNELESLQERLKQETKEWLSIKLALEVLKQSKQKYEKERQPEVITRTRDYFKAMTDNAYADLRISLSEKQVSIIDASGNTKTVIQLSRGTKEQLLLSLRLGLIEEYEKNTEPLPVALDDIMVNFDTKRRDNVTEVLFDFAKERQVLFFTCHQSTKELFEGKGARVIEW